MRKLIACVTLSLTTLVAGEGQAGFFIHTFDMNGDYAKHLHSTSNARVWDERPNGLPVRYWAPTRTGVLGVVIYRYEFSEAIKSASLFANILAHRSGDQTFLDVSADGVNYTTVASGYVHPDLSPPYTLPVNDLTSILAGSTTAYVRARMVGSQLNSSIFSSQFLRTANDVPWFKSPYVYQFQAETAAVPGPATLPCAGAGLALLGCWWRWRRGRPAPCRRREVEPTQPAR